LRLQADEAIQRFLILGSSFPRNLSSKFVIGERESRHTNNQRNIRREFIRPEIGRPFVLKKYFSDFLRMKKITKHQSKDLTPEF